MDFILPDFASPAVWVSLFTLSFLEMVLGIDNIIFIAIVAGKLPVQQQRKARTIGLLLAMIFRVGLLRCINWIISLKDPVLTIAPLAGFTNENLPLRVKDLFLLQEVFF